MTAIVQAAAVREYMALNSTASDSKYTDATIGSNINAAINVLERHTHRRLAPVTQTLKFTTNGAAIVTIPGLRTATSVTLQGAVLVADSTYWLINDPQQTGVATAVQLRAFGTQRQGSYLSNPEWFDRNLDSPKYYGGFSSLPNDLVIVGDWGYVDDSTMPEAVRHHVKVLASFFTKRPDALLSGGITTPDGNSFDLSHYPVEVQDFIREWDAGSQATGL